MIKKLKSTIGTSIRNKKINVFLLFLLLSFTILIFSKLSKDYTNTIIFNINKINVPQEHVILSDSNNKLSITLKTHGFKWLSYYLTKPKITIDFTKDVIKKDSKYIWAKSKNYLYASKQFNDQVELLNMSPDTLMFNYDVNLVKKIPVILNADINFSPGYDILKTFKIKPDSIIVIGPEVLAAKIESVETEKIILKDVKFDVLKNVSLKLPKDNKDLKFSNDNISLSLAVEKFTEGTLKIPVAVINIPDSINLKYFPKVVNVIYYTSLNNFNKISPKDFKVTCDYSKITNDQTFLIPELTLIPEVVKNAKINQQHIEFIITE